MENEEWMKNGLMDKRILLNVALTRMFSLSTSDGERAEVRCRIGQTRPFHIPVLGAHSRIMAGQKKQPDWEQAVNGSGFAGPQTSSLRFAPEDPLNHERHFIPLPHDGGHVKIAAELVRELDADGKQLYAA